MLLFKAKYREAILDGTKTTTLRAWKRPLVRAGRDYRTNHGDLLHVESVEIVALDALDDTIAQADGFGDAGALLDALRSIYSTLPASLYLVRFSVTTSTQIRLVD